MTSLLLLALAASASSQAPAWHLVNILDDDGQARAQAANVKHAKAYRFTVQYARDLVRGSSALTHTYIGPTDENFRPPHIRGASFTLDCRWNSPPAKLEAREAVRLRLQGRVGRRSHAWPLPGLNMAAQIVLPDREGRWVVEAVRFRTVKRGEPLVLGAGNDFRPVDAEVTAPMPSAPSSPKRYGVKVTASAGNTTTTTTYIYAWGAPEGGVELKPYAAPGR
ncbi:MAG: hypothetical protein MH204_11705 [Fimbriimonadaceae bacterium]|nr:hypothetical protein [Fimbriimonadaceae bacterium]